MGWLRMRERSVEGWWSPDQPRFWWSLIGIGAALRLIGALVTPISVDTYLHATYVQNFIDGGSFALDWGPNRNPIYPWRAIRTAWGVRSASATSSGTCG